MLLSLAESVLYVQYDAKDFCRVFFVSKLRELISRVVSFAKSPNFSKCILPADNPISGTVGPKTLCSLCFEHKYVEQSVPIYDWTKNNLLLVIAIKQHLITISSFRKLLVTYCVNNALNFLSNAKSFTIII